MIERNKVWLTLGVALMTGGPLGTGMEAEAAGGNVPVAEHSGADAASKSAWRVAQHHGGGERARAGERGKAGEGGEGGGERAGAANLTRSDSAYLTQLGLIRGHLNVGTELYRTGDREMAVTHMKHPEDELYAALKPVLAKRGAPDFDRELSVLAEKVERNAGEAEVKAAYDSLMAAIDKAERAVAKPSPHQIGEVIHNLVRVAADEYDVAVADGRIVEAHEYQDALGFVRIAEDWLKRLDAAGADPAIVAEIRKQITGIKPAWTGVVPPQTVSVEPSQLHGAAARIEIAALGLKQ